MPQVVEVKRMNPLPGFHAVHHLAWVRITLQKHLQFLCRVRAIDAVEERCNPVHRCISPVNDLLSTQPKWCVPLGNRRLLGEKHIPEPAFAHILVSGSQTKRIELI